MTSQHHHHQQHNQEPNKTMQHHQATHQQGLLLERRIIQLLTETNLTFKEIIIKLDGENLSASIGMIRRINRDNRYRRPRYDSKLTPAQRESLVEELRDHKGMKPNLSLLAKRYGVCHGSVWYWWDKLNRIKRCDPMGRRGAGSSGLVDGKLCVGRTQLQMFPEAVGGRDGRRRRATKTGLFNSGVDYDQQSGSGSSMSSSGNNSGGGMARDLYRQRWRNINNILHDERYNYVGRVRIVGRNGQAGEQLAGEGPCPIELPILMFARRELGEIDSVKTSASSSSLGLSPSPIVTVDDVSFEEDNNCDDDEDDEDDKEEGDSCYGLTRDELEPRLLSAEERLDLQRVGLAAAEASLG